uniref:Uncharacterized protein n=1 Tax=Arundo donax TaxID=35708 RepID=A0A0A8ZB30_ARUDO
MFHSTSYFAEHMMRRMPQYLGSMVPKLIFDNLLAPTVLFFLY